MKEYRFIYRDHAGKHHQLTTHESNVVAALQRFVNYCKAYCIDPVSVTVDLIKESVI